MMTDASRAGPWGSAGGGLHLLLAAWIRQLETTRHRMGTQYDKGDDGRCDKTSTGEEKAVTLWDGCGVWSDDGAMSEVLEIKCGLPAHQSDAIYARCRAQHPC